MSQSQAKEQFQKVRGQMGYWIPLLSLLVQFATLLALLYYAWETWKIRKASEEQGEAQCKPCLTLVTERRDAVEAILDQIAVGTSELAARDGNVVLENMGKGPAINIRYQVARLDAAPGRRISEPSGYLQNIAAEKAFVVPVARGHFENGEYKFVATYESIGAWRYETTITINSLVLTGYNFRRITTDG
jgi:hypothetical protein